MKTEMHLNVVHASLVELYETKNALPGDSLCMRQRKIWGDVEGKPVRIREQ